MAGVVLNSLVNLTGFNSLLNFEIIQYTNFIISSAFIRQSLIGGKLKCKFCWGCVLDCLSIWWVEALDGLAGGAGWIWKGSAV